MALSSGAQRPHHLAAVTGCRWDETGQVLRDLQQRWMVTHEAGVYALTRSGHFLASRLLTCATGLFRALYSRPGFSLPPLPLVAEGVLDDIGHLTEPSYLEAFQNPDDAEGEMKEWMASHGYVSETDDALCLTLKGEAYLTFLDRCGRAIATIERFNTFFESHAIENIPGFAIQRIGDLMNAGLVVDTPVNAEQKFDYFLKIIGEAQHLHGVSTFSLPFIAEAIWERVTAGAGVELVITPELAVPLLQEEFFSTGRNTAAFPNFKLFVSTVPIAVGLTVTDRALSLGLFLADGTYDTVQDLVSRAPEATRWGERLFQYYREHSVPIEDFFQNPGVPTESARSGSNTGPAPRGSA